MEVQFADVLKGFTFQNTWIATNDRPVKDITATVKKAYDLMSVHVFE
ncbi:putative alcohol dehydrogenase, partial [Operophtera brumata]